MRLAPSPEEQRRTIGERTHTHRRRHRGLSQRVLSARLGWGANRVSQVERAEVDLTTTELYRLAESLGVSVEYLLGLTDDYALPDEDVTVNWSSDERVAA